MLPISDSSDERSGSWSYEITVPRQLAEAIVEYYDGDDGVGSVPDALRQAARDVLLRGE